MNYRVMTRRMLPAPRNDTRQDVYSVPWCERSDQLDNLRAYFSRAAAPERGAIATAAARTTETTFLDSRFASGHDWLFRLRRCCR